MNRVEMINALMPEAARAGDFPVAARRRLWRMSAENLQRELLMRGLIEYEDPPSDETFDDTDEVDCGTRALLGLPSMAFLSD